MEAFRNFWAKLRNSYKSWTVWFGAIVTIYGGVGPFLEAFQVQWLPIAKPFLAPGVYTWVMCGIGLVIIYLRFKTITSLVTR